MKKNEQKWLQDTLNAGSGELSAEDIYVLVGDTSLSSESLLAGIQFVETWLSARAAPSLVQVLRNDSRPMEVRECAARALAKIDEETVEAELVLLSTNNDISLRELAALALNKGPL